MIQVDLNDRRHLHAAQVILQRIQIEKRRPNIPHHRYASPLPSTPPPPPPAPPPAKPAAGAAGTIMTLAGDRVAMRRLKVRRTAMQSAALVWSSLA